ncbi:odorant receptor 131-2-like [Festucalex cinctus]
MRYILFANMLLNDCCFLVVSDVLLLLYQFDVSMHLGLCMLAFFVMVISLLVTACTLTAMTLERYVAVCMPLRHAELCSSQRALRSVVVIGGLSSIPCVVFYFTIFPAVADGHYPLEVKCSAANLEAHLWQNFLRSAVYLAYFLAMGGIIIFCYVRIMRVAKAASARDREASRKGLRTVTLHGFQLVLCLMHLLLPPIEKALAQVDYSLFRNVRLFNFITFILAPRCLSPLVYGLRDEMFFTALKYYILCGLSQKP